MGERGERRFFRARAVFAFRGREEGTKDACPGLRLELEASRTPRKSGVRLSSFLRFWRRVDVGMGNGACWVERGEGTELAFLVLMDVMEGIF